MLNPTSYSPCLADLAGRLAGPDCASALATLVLLPAYTAMIDLAAHGTQQGICTRIVHVLATHGMASPGTVAWLYECTSTDPELHLSLLSSLPLSLKLSSSIWSTRKRVIIDVDAPSLLSASGAPDDESVAITPVSPSVSRATRTSAGSRSKKPAPYPPSRPAAQRRATDDDVRAAQTLVRPPAPPLPEEVIEITSESDMSEVSDVAPTTVRRAPSPSLPVVSPELESAPDLSPPAPAPAPIIMSPSPLPPRVIKGSKGSKSAKAAPRKLPPAQRTQPGRPGKAGLTHAHSED